MLFFRRRSNIHADFSSIGVDMHSHLIPGVDDGAIDSIDSIAIINGLKSLGFKHLFTTPHTLQDIHPNTKQTLLDGYSKISEHIPEGISLKLSSEYNLDEHFQQQLEKKELLTLPGNRLLVEFSQIIKPHNLEEVVFDLGIKGYQVVLAHPERYLFFHKNFDYYKRLREMGVELQVNALSLTKHYGEHVNKIAEKLIDKEMIEFIGTDIHHLQHLDKLKTVPATKYFKKLVDSELLKNKSLHP